MPPKSGAGTQAALGSIYNFLPRGKRQLGEEAIRRSGALYDLLIDAVFDAAPDVLTSVSGFFLGAAAILKTRTSETHAVLPRSPWRSPAPTRRCALPQPRRSTAGSVNAATRLREPASRR